MMRATIKRNRLIRVDACEQCKLLGEALGVGLGCWAGMAPLLLAPDRFAKKDAGGDAAAVPSARPDGGSEASGSAADDAAPPLRDISKEGFST